MMTQRTLLTISRNSLHFADVGGRSICRMNVSQLWTTSTNSCEFSVTRLMLGVSNAELERDHGIPEPPPVQIHHCRRFIRGSHKKMNWSAKQIARLPIQEAIRQMEFSPKKAAGEIKEVLEEAQQIAVEKHGVKDKTNLWVAQSYSGRGTYLKRIRYHGKGMFGQMKLSYCHYFVILQEGPPKERNKRRKISQMDELEKIKNHPKHIRNSLAWW